MPDTGHDGDGDERLSHTNSRDWVHDDDDDDDDDGDGGDGDGDGDMMVMMTEI